MNFLLLAQEAAPGAGQQPPMSSMLIPLVLMMVVMVFLVVLPASRQRKQQQALLATLKKGDKVLTQAGILGTIVAMKDEAPGEVAEVTLRVDDNTNSRIRVLKSTVTNILSRSDEPETK